MSAQTRRHGCGRVGFESSEFRAFDLREKRQEGLVSAIWATGDRVRAVRTTWLMVVIVLSGREGGRIYNKN